MIYRRNSMKLIFTILQDEDSRKVIAALSAAGHSVTKMNSSGGFLRSGNTTLLIGSIDANVDKIIDIIKQNSRSRKQAMSSSSIPYNYTSIMGNEGTSSYGDFSGSSYDVEIDIGGATIFVMNCNKIMTEK
jgi:uncharacterized protein YaaQ